MSNAPQTLAFARFPGRRGLTWLARAYDMFVRHRWRWIALVVVYFCVLLALRVIPVVGPYAMTLLKPVFAVGLLAAAWTQERGSAPAPGLLLQGFRANVVALLAIGAFFMAGITLALFGATLIDGGKLLELMSAAEPVSEEQLAATLADPSLQLGMLFAAALSLPVVVATWWAPALVVFQDAKAGAALAASLRAALANWRPLLVYGCGVLCYGIAPFFFISMAALILPALAVSWIMIGLLLPYWLVFIATLHVSDYVSYRDVFHAGETLAPLAKDCPVP